MPRPWITPLLFPLPKLMKMMKSTTAVMRSLILKIAKMMMLNLKVVYNRPIPTE